MGAAFDVRQLLGALAFWQGGRLGAGLGGLGGDGVLPWGVWSGVLVFQRLNASSGCLYSLICVKRDAFQCCLTDNA